MAAEHADITWLGFSDQLLLHGCENACFMASLSLMMRMFSLNPDASTIL
jgi:hypothetical protein